MSETIEFLSGVGSMSVAQALGVWTELARAYYGEAHYGGDVAEIYAYTLLPNMPSAIGGRPVSPSTVERHRGLYRSAARALAELCVAFEAKWECQVAIDGSSPGDWAATLGASFAHRVHVKVVHPSAAPTAAATGDSQSVDSRLAALEKIFATLDLEHRLSWNEKTLSRLAQTQSGPTPSAVPWTTDFPDRPGWFWAWHEYDDEPVAVKVVMVNQGLVGMSFRDEYRKGLTPSSLRWLPLAVPGRTSSGTQTATAVEWTSEAPTEPGWYWFYGRRGGGPIQLWALDASSRQVIYNGMAEFVPSEHVGVYARLDVPVLPGVR